jgi:hypothetical protein
VKSPTLKDAVRAIDKRGALLVYPLDNRKEPSSLWSEFYPRSQMRWEWDSGGDNRVAELWHLREELSRSGKVVYAKWFRGRATFLSRDLVPHLLATLAPGEAEELGLVDEAREMLEALEMDSPLSTKALKERVDLKGKFYESTYTKATKQLWERLLIVGYGEVDDGAFPSLAMGATRLLFEDLWHESRSLDRCASADKVRAALGEESPFYRFWKKLLP